MRKVEDATPCGTQVLVERISDSELMSSASVIVPENYVSGGAPQGYVRRLGPRLEQENWGFNVGDRVVLVGNYTPLPEVPSAKGRELILVEPHQIKAILVEEPIA